MNDFKVIVCLILPWWDEDDKAQYSRMTLTGPRNEITQKVAKEQMLHWYKTHIGVKPPYALLGRIWSRRIVSRPMSEESINQYLTELAHASYNEITNTSDKEATSTGSGV